MSLWAVLSLVPIAMQPGMKLTPNQLAALQKSGQMIRPAPLSAGAVASRNQTKTPANAANPKGKQQLDLKWVGVDNFS